MQRTVPNAPECTRPVFFNEMCRCLHPCGTSFGRSAEAPVKGVWNLSRQMGRHMARIVALRFFGVALGGSCPLFVWTFYDSEGPFPDHIYFRRRFDRKPFSVFFGRVLNGFKHNFQGFNVLLTSGIPRKGTQSDHFSCPQNGV